MVRLSAAAFVVALLVVAAPGAAQARASCSVPRGARVAFIDAAAVTVYTVRGVHKHQGKGRSYFACSAPSGRRTSLGFVADEFCAGLDSVGPYSAAGPYLAYADAYLGCDGNSQYAEVYLLDLRGGKTAKVSDAAGSSDDVSTARRPVTAIATRPDGAMAWIVDTLNIDTDQPGVFEVWVDDAAGRRQVDKGTDVARAPLMLTDTATWMKGGTSASAPVGPGPAKPSPSAR
jgi:hypothetical protein